jgi:clan AA aspartic protease
MIRGTVTSRQEAVVPLRVRAPGGAECDVDTIIDTGFTGFLTLPPALISALNLPFRSQVNIKLGDGTTHQFDTYDIEIDWNGAWRLVVATEIDADPLLGMGLLAGHQVFIEFVPGGVVDITPIP